MGEWNGTAVAKQALSFWDYSFVIALIEGATSANNAGPTLAYFE